MKKVLGTGGTWMIGRYLVPKLLSKDYEGHTGYQRYNAFKEKN